MMMMMMMMNKETYLARHTLSRELSLEAARIRKRTWRNIFFAR